MSASKTLNENINPKPLGSVSRYITSESKISKNDSAIHGLHMTEECMVDGRKVKGREYNFVIPKPDEFRFIVPLCGKKALFCKVAKAAGLDKHQKDICLKLLKKFAKILNQVSNEESFERSTGGSMDLRGTWINANLVRVFLDVFPCSELNKLFEDNVDEQRCTIIHQCAAEEFKLEIPVDQMPVSKKTVNIKNTRGRQPSKNSKEQQREKLIRGLRSRLLELRKQFEQQKAKSK